MSNISINAPTSVQRQLTSPSHAGLQNGAVDRFLARHPIFDLRQKVFGYELLFRAGPINVFQASRQASTRAIADSTMDFDFQALTGPSRAFLNVDQAALLRRAPLMLLPDRVILEIQESVSPSAELMEICREHCRGDFALALDDFRDLPRWRPLLDHVRYLKVNFRSVEPAARRAIAGKYLAQGFELIAHKVETQRELSEARNLGFTYFQGFFFCQPAMETRKDIPGSKLQRLRLIEALCERELSYPKIEEILRQDPSLAYKLLRFMNSPLLGLRTEVLSIRHALALLGEKEFRRWVSVVTVATMATEKPGELIRLALTRAQFCEELAKAAGLGIDSGEYFLMGLLSVIDALLDRPMTQVLAQLPIAPEICHALSGGRNKLRDVYDAMIAYERAEWASFAEQAANLGIGEEHVPGWYLAAVRRADSVAV